MGALGSSPCPSAHMTGVWIHTAATSLTMQRLASDLVINPLTSLCSYISAPPIYLATLASCAANMHNKEEWNAGITNMTVREGDVHDCDPVRQGHVSAFLVTSSEFARVSLACQFCSPTALTLGRFAASLPLSLPLPVSLPPPSPLSLLPSLSLSPLSPSLPLSLSSLVSPLVSPLSLPLSLPLSPSLPEPGHAMFVWLIPLTNEISRWRFPRRDASLRCADTHTRQKSKHRMG